MTRWGISISGSRYGRLYTVQRMVSLRCLITRSIMWSCCPGPTAMTSTPIAFMSLTSAAMPRSLSLVNFTMEMRRDPMVPNMRLMLCLSTGVVRLSTQATKMIPSEWVIDTKNSWRLMNITSQCMCWSSKCRAVVVSCGGDEGLILVVHPLSEAVFAPQIAVARAISSGNMLQLKNIPALKAEMNFWSGGNPKLACKRLYDASLNFAFCEFWIVGFRCCKCSRLKHVFWWCFCRCGVSICDSVLCGVRISWLWRRCQIVDKSMLKFVGILISIKQRCILIYCRTLTKLPVVSLQQAIRCRDDGKSSTWIKMNDANVAKVFCFSYSERSMRAIEHSRSACHNVTKHICTCDDGACSSCIEDGFRCTLLVDVTIGGKFGPRTEGCEFH